MRVRNSDNLNNIDFTALRVPPGDVSKARQMILDAGMGVFSKLEINGDVLILSPKEDEINFLAGTSLEGNKDIKRLKKLHNSFVQKAQNLTLEELSIKLQELLAIKKQSSKKFAEIFGKNG